MSMGHGAVVMWAHVPHGAHEHQGLSCVVACILGSLAWVRCFRAVVLCDYRLRYRYGASLGV